MQNFGRIKNTFNELLTENVGLGNNPHKTLFKKYVKLLKESEILKTQFLIYSNIEEKIETNPATTSLFVSENLRLMEKFNITDIINENKKLLKLSKSINKNINNAYDDKLTGLHEAISKVVCTKRTPSNIEVISENMTKIVDYIKENKPKEIVEQVDLPNSMLSSLLVDKYNEKYSDISESDRKLIKVLVTATDAEKENVYSDTIRECIDMINVKLIDSDLDIKDSLLRVKDKLLNDKKELSENFIERISKLINLKNSLID